MRLANRTKELEFFRRMLRGEVTQRILLVEAPSGFGKTDLLAKFGHNCSQRQLVQIDLKGASSGVIYLISRFQKKLGQNHFPHYEKAVREFLTAGVEIADNKIVGEENTLQVILQGVDESQRDFRFNRLQDAFFQDLAQFPQPILLLLDTFNAAPEQLRDWISCRFLAEVAENLPNLIVVVAGQEVPERTIEWGSCHHCFQLNAILEIDAWFQYAQDQGFTFSRDVVWTVVQLTKGQPAEIVKTLETLERSSRQ